ncbi:MAG: helix-turn-helix domain-containing protein, partial [Opitutaceae bacterium]
AVETIRTDYVKPLVLSEVARASGQSVRHLQRCFRNAFGISPQEFLIRTRVLAAAKLLEETSLTAAKIAQESGFVDASGFSQHFQRRTGVTPTAYRKQRKAP